MQVHTGITTVDGLKSVCGMAEASADDRGKVYYYHIKWNDAILSSGMFRLNRNCTINGQTYDYNAL